MKELLVSRKHLLLLACLLFIGWTDLWAAQPASDIHQEKIASTQSLSQFGITWTFIQPVTFGQFANGDYWVLGRGAVHLIRGMTVPCMVIMDPIFEII